LPALPRWHLHLSGERRGAGGAAARARTSRRHARTGSTAATATAAPDASAAGRSRLSATRVRNAGRPVTTLATLVRALDIDNDADQKRLRELLYNFRIEGVIAFDRPLGRFSAIRRAARATPS
jgi:hypothetical protein